MIENSLDVYTSNYVHAQLRKFRNRHDNHWRYHISLAKKLVSEYSPQASSDILDLGCSIGTFAIEFALDGYKTIGLDFDPKALNEAEKLAKENGVQPKWICEDARSFKLNNKVDIVVCFDLLEHLSDDAIRDTLHSVHNNLNDNGFFIFHTFPTEFDHIFYRNFFICLPLIPFKKLEYKKFERAVRLYSGWINLYYLLRYGKTHKKLIQKTVHPNPLSIDRVQKFLKDAGFDILLLEAGIDDINPLKNGQGGVAKKYFSKHAIAQRSIWGVAKKVIK